MYAKKKKKNTHLETNLGFRGSGADEERCSLRDRVLNVMAFV